MANVVLKNIAKQFGDVVAVNDVNLEIADREFVVLVGPSGCGKTTTLRMIAGLEEISGGEISIGDRVVNKLTPMERNIAMVFQSYALYPHKTVGENIAFPLTEGQRLRGKAVRERVEEIAEQKWPDLTAADMDAAVRTIAGSARSAGIEVEGV